MMGRICLGTAIAALLSSAAGAAPILGLYNTGVDDAGVATVGNGPDRHWSLAGGAAYTGGSNNLFPLGPWLLETSGSRWLTPTTNAADNVAATTYVYGTTFSLAGYDAATAKFAGRFAGDNDVIAIMLNGKAISAGASGYRAFTAFDSIGGTFLGGLNTLDFVVANAGGPGGVRVEVAGDADLAAMVPEPSTWALMIIGFGLVGLVRRQPVALTT